MIQREVPSLLSALQQSRDLRISRKSPVIHALCRALLQAGRGTISAERCRRSGGELCRRSGGELWRFGISGDIPILCCDGRAAEAESVLKTFCLLKSCGLEADLLYFSGEHGEYRQPIQQKLYRALAAVGLEALIGCPGGVRTVPPPEAADLIRSRAAVTVGAGKTLLPRLCFPIPPAKRSPGYISGYGEGYRENGGQYTHGAIWLAMAALMQGRRDEGRELLHMLLPENHDLSRYEAEPFVLPADVYAAPGREGLAGWTWYTGSAGWYFRVVSRDLLGLRLEDGQLHISPKLPAAIRRYSVQWTDPSGKEHNIVYDSGRITRNGEEYRD